MPSSQNHFPSPARYEFVTGFTTSVRGVVGEQLVEAELDAEVPPHAPDTGAEQRGLDQLALPGPLAGEQRGVDAGHEGHGGHVIAHPAADHRRLFVGRIECGGDAAPRPERPHVIAGAVGVRTPRAVSRDRRVDESGVDRHHLDRSEPEPVDGGRTEVGEEHIGVTDQVEHHAPALLVGQIGDDAPLAPVVEIERRRLRLAVAGEKREDPPHRIALGRLDLDHLGSPVGQHPAGTGPGDPHPEFDDVHTCEWSHESANLDGGRSEHERLLDRPRFPHGPTGPNRPSSESPTATTARSTSRCTRPAPARPSSSVTASPNSPSRGGINSAPSPTPATGPSPPTCAATADRRGPTPSRPTASRSCAGDLVGPARRPRASTRRCSSATTGVGSSPGPWACCIRTGSRASSVCARPYMSMAPTSVMREIFPNDEDFYILWFQPDGVAESVMDPKADALFRVAASRRHLATSASPSAWRRAPTGRR